MSYTDAIGSGVCDMATSKLDGLSIPKLWDQPSKPLSFVNFSEVEIQIIGTPSVAYQLQRSFDGVNFSNYSPRDVEWNRHSTLSTDGFYIVEGGAFIRFSAGQGSIIWTRAENVS